MDFFRNNLDEVNENSFLYGIFKGVVEDRNDPKQLGRCRIRIFGVHSDKKEKGNLDGIPTEELPWLEMCAPLNGGSSGFGTFSVPLNGSIVYCFFEKGDILKGRYFAIAPGFTPSLNLGYNNKSNYENIELGEIEPLEINDWKLGDISKREESGTEGSLKISNGSEWGDPGGNSYGSWQFASKNGSVTAFLNSTHSEIKNKFNGLTPGSKEFSVKWKEVVQEIGVEKFQEIERAYCTKIYYLPVASAARSMGIKERCAGVEEMYWSMGIQHGGAGAKKIIERSLINDSMSDEEIILTVYNERKKVDIYFKSSNSKIKSSVYNRFCREEKEMIALCQKNPNPNEIEIKKPNEKDILQIDKESIIENSLLNPIPTNETFKDPNGTYPTKARESESDFHRLAKGITERTAFETRNKNLDGDKKPIFTSTFTTFKEPESIRNTKYGDNYVIATHGGVSLELDSSKGSEAFRINHPSNTYVEINASGDYISKTSKDKFESIIGSSKTHVANNYNLSIDGSYDNFIQMDSSKTIMGSSNTKILQNHSLTVGLDSSIIINGNNTVRIFGKDNKYVLGQQEIMVFGQKSETVIGSNTLAISSNYTVNAQMISMYAGMIFLN